MYRHLFFLLFFAFALFIATAAGGETDKNTSPESEQADSRIYIRKLEKRISDLEALVKLLLEAKASGNVSAQSAVDKSGKGEKGIDPAPGEEDEWSEPVVEQNPAQRRDEEARRRLTELETWKRKVDAKTAQEAEEEDERVKLHLSGKYKVRVNSRNNLNLNNESQFWQFDNSSYLDQRIQLKLDAEYGPLSAAVVFDKGNFVFDWKEDSEGTLERWGEFLTVNSTFLREGYVQYTGRFVAKVGRQNMMLGNGGIVLEGPVDAFQFTFPFGKTTIGPVSGSLAYIANAGAYANYTGITYPPGVGNRGNALLGTPNKLDAVLLNFDIRPRRDLSISPYMLKVIDRGRLGDPDLNLDKDYNPTTTPRDGGFQPTWIGITLSGRNGRLTYNGDFIYLAGSYTKERNYKANAVIARGDYNLSGILPSRNISAGLEFGRGSGSAAEEKVSGTGDVRDFTGLFLCKERRKFGNIFSEDLRAGYFLADSNLTNVTFLRLILGFEPINMVRTDFALSRLLTTERVHKGRGPVRDWSAGTSTTTETTRNIGWELDVNLSFPIYKRLRGFTELGYFLPGDVYRQENGRKARPASEVVIGTEFEF